MQIAFDEWPFYSAHPQLVPAFWLGGMATHGLLLGAAAATAVFAVVVASAVPRARRRAGRSGCVSHGHRAAWATSSTARSSAAVTDGWWGVKFPYAEGFRHPVVLYDGAKNLLLMLYLLHVRRTNRTPGAVAARFVFWYAFPRIFIDLLRDYPAHRLALGTGQTLNLVMAALGAVLLCAVATAAPGPTESGRPAVAAHPWPRGAARLTVQRVGFAVLLAGCVRFPATGRRTCRVATGAAIRASSTRGCTRRSTGRRHRPPRRHRADAGVQTSRSTSAGDTRVARRTGT